MTVDLAQPSEPPEMPRRVRLHPFQLIGIPILFLLPVALASPAYSVKPGPPKQRQRRSSPRRCATRRASATRS